MGRCDWLDYSAGEKAQARELIHMARRRTFQEGEFLASFSRIAFFMTLQCDLCFKFCCVDRKGLSRGPKLYITVSRYGLLIESLFRCRGALANADFLGVLCGLSFALGRFIFPNMQDLSFDRQLHKR